MMFIVVDLQEGLSKKERIALKEAEAAQQVALRAASLKRAKAEAAAMEGASWGMQEDAEEVEEVCFLSFFSLSLRHLSSIS